MNLINLLISGIDNSLLSSNNLFKASKTSESFKFISSKIIQKPSLTALTRKPSLKKKLPFLFVVYVPIYSSTSVF